ncbi:hypothetical protein KKB99_02245, partial [bacterium]|nr:hypothetical protein [bacterium]MBU1024808.1 hypothetical protein [bacterium]
MINNLRAVIAIFLLFVILNGCSSGGNNPVIPRNTELEESTIDLPLVSESGSHSSERIIPARDQVDIVTIEDTYFATGILGTYELILDSNDMSAELFSTRRSSLGEGYLVSGSSFFTIRPCTDCLRIQSIRLTPEGYIQLTLSISHPFDKGDMSKPPSAINRRDLDVFDLAAVLVPSTAALELFSLSGIQAYAKMSVEADGYTRELSTVTGDPEACPYFLVVDDSEIGISTFNKFEMGTKDLNFDLIFTGGGVFQIYMTMGYGASAIKSSRLNPKYYNPEFNRKSSWKIEVTTPEGNNPPEWGNTWDSVDTTTPYDVLVKVWDWQQDAVIATDYPDVNNPDHIYASSNVGSVSVEIQGMNNALQTSLVPESGDGTPANPLNYRIPIVNEKNLPVGQYFGLVKVTDDRVPASSIVPGQVDSLVHSPDGVILDWYPISEFASYQTFIATVVFGENITVTNPNGGETWTYTEPATIEWTSVGSTTNVNIELSLDSGQNYTIPIANNIPNTGTYSFGPAGVGEWITDSARIRIYNISDPATIDESDADFSIVCPGLNPPSNVSATDDVYPDKVTVSWDAEPGATGYNIYRDDAPIMSNYVGVTWDDTTVVPGTIYNYQLQSLRGNCTSAKSAYEQGNACVLPGIPSNVSATDGDFYNKVTVSWTAGTLADSYNIYRDSIIRQSNYVGTSWDDTTVVMGVNYSYQIESVNDCGTSDLSIADTGYACVLPDTPSNVSATDGAFPDKVRVTWNAANLATSYNIYRDSSLRQSGYTLTTWDDTSVTPGTVYSYQVESVNTCGNSALSSADNGNACVLPGTPTGLSATDGVYQNRVNLSWNTATLASSYNIYRDSSLLQSNIAGTTYSDYSASRGVIYSYQVESQNSCGASTAKSTADTGYALGCAGTDGNDSCSVAEQTALENNYPPYVVRVSGCVDQIDEDWYHFYVSPNGFTSSSSIILTIPSGTVNIYIYGIDPGGTCPGTLLNSATNVGSTTVNMPSNSNNDIYVRLIGNSGMINYTMETAFVPTITNVPIAIYVATDDGTPTGTWPLDGSLELTLAILDDMVRWTNEFWNPYGYNYVWSGAVEEFMSADYYSLDNWTEEAQMHTDYNTGPAKVDLYFVENLPPGYNTAYCWVFENQADHNAS